MARLAAVVLCERTIIEQDSNQVTLVALLEKLTVKSQKGSDLADAAIPQSWSLFTYWQDLPAAEGTSLVQETELLAPDGTVLLNQPTPFSSVGWGHRVYLHGKNFPVGQTGHYTFRVLLRKEGVDDEVLGTGVYGVEVAHEFLEEAEKESGSSKDTAPAP